MLWMLHIIFHMYMPYLYKKLQLQYYEALWTWVRSLCWEVLLEEGMATHSRVLAWRIPWTEEPEVLQFMGSQRGRHNWSDLATHWLWGILAISVIITIIPKNNMNATEHTHEQELLEWYVIWTHYYELWIIYLKLLVLSFLINKVGIIIVYILYKCGELINSFKKRTWYMTIVH